jgi:hypothetical protein
MMDLVSLYAFFHIVRPLQFPFFLLIKKRFSIKTLSPDDFLRFWQTVRSMEWPDVL